MNSVLFKVLGKGRKERLVPFSVELRKFLHQWHQKKEKGGWTGEWVFPTRDGSRLTQRNALRAHYILLAKVGLPKSGFHRLRHTFATNYLRAGGNIANLPTRSAGVPAISVGIIWLRTP